jgi:hypothetical protein
MRAESVALIPRCAECEAAWLPVDEERWAAYLTDDEPPDVFFIARSVPTGSWLMTESSARLPFCPLRLGLDCFGHCVSPAA